MGESTLYAFDKMYGLLNPSIQPEILIEIKLKALQWSDVFYHDMQGSLWISVVRQ